MTGTGAFFTTFSATLPKKVRSRPFRPWVPIGNDFLGGLGEINGEQNIFEGFHINPISPAERAPTPAVLPAFEKMVHTRPHEHRLFYISEAQSCQGKGSHLFR
jgi:hypothetical protein